MPNAAPRCFCGARATQLCDYIIASPLAGINKQLTSLALDPYTCDMPLCEAHARWPKGVFICGRDVEPFEYCPLHIQAHEADTGEGAILILTPEEAAVLRAKVHGEIKRQYDWARRRATIHIIAPQRQRQLELFAPR
jgi:hypothetical protein